MGKKTETITTYTCDCCMQECDAGEIFSLASKAIVSVAIPRGVVTLFAVLSIAPHDTELDVCKRCVVKCSERMIAEI